MVHQLLLDAVLGYKTPQEGTLGIPMDSVGPAFVLD